MRQKAVQIGTRVILLLFLLFLLILIKAWVSGEFKSVESFQGYMSKFGVFAPVMLTFFQAAQVVLPVLPGFLGCAVGAVMFGSAVGFWCNYIGISAGSIIAFFLARRYGAGLVEDIFKGGQIR